MKPWKNIGEIRAVVDACKRDCAAKGVPFHADALAAALGISYETLARYAAGKGSAAGEAAVLTAALQDCTAAVLTDALDADPKSHAFYMWYLRNRGGFSDKAGEMPRGESGVTFIGEGRI